ncbi:conserved hypothetical protein [Shewanella sediminis HAW-EB3]|uniref:Uncharacterized protein n=1 Tax=Shewanella sediminis (strain HAW-EB3) TaxID=425104 RepID=A8G1Y3_SHESH|nr:hypothetical protein [Shewanella sediminis]ABV39106.1 conserved hypothetical protein [Shewanella sediminis HAW-EB3]
MLQYKQEFGDGFELGFELGNFPHLEDKSWKDEACPSFMFKLKSGLGHAGFSTEDAKPRHNSLEEYLVLWVDYPNSEERENTTTSRYSIVTATNLGSLHEPEIYHDEHSFTLFETEESEALTQYLSDLHIEPFYPR